MDEIAFFAVCSQIKQFQVDLLKDAEKLKIVYFWCFVQMLMDKGALPVIGELGKSAEPRCFKNFNTALYVDYECNKKALMTAAFFQKWQKIFQLRDEKNQTQYFIDFR